MPVYLAAALTFALYAGAVPVKFALILRVSGQAGFGAGASVFEGSHALRRAEKRARGQRRHLPWRDWSADVKRFRSAAALLRRLLRGSRLEVLRARGRVGLQDAAQTALACGLLRALEAALSARLGPQAVRFEVEPDFSGGGSEWTLWGMFSLSAGQIILGALSAAREFVARRLREWTDIPLRIS